MDVRPVGLTARRCPMGWRQANTHGGASGWHEALCTAPALPAVLDAGRSENAVPHGSGLRNEPVSRALHATMPYRAWGCARPAPPSPMVPRSGGTFQANPALAAGSAGPLPGSAGDSLAEVGSAPVQGRPPAAAPPPPAGAGARPPPRPQVGGRGLSAVSAQEPGSSAQPCKMRVCGLLPLAPARSHLGPRGWGPVWRPGPNSDRARAGAGLETWPKL